jgi:hypothetical protein
LHRSKISTGEQTVGSRSGHQRPGRSERHRFHIHRPGQHEVVESADIQHRHIGVQRRIAVGREKPSSRLVLPNCHIYVQRLIYRRNRSRDVQDHAVRVRSRHRQAIRLEELNQLVVICLGGAKALGKLTRTQIAPVVWAPRIGDLFQKTVEIFAIAQRQANSQTQPSHAGERA